MGLEVASYISQLVPTNPLGTDSKAQGDNHLRMLKQVLQNQFPNLGEDAVTATAVEINAKLAAVDGVDWKVAEKTGSFTAETGKGYFVSGASLTVTLPDSPSDGDLVYLSDRLNNWSTNNITVTGGTKAVDGDLAGKVLDVDGGFILFVYVDSLGYWKTGNVPSKPQGTFTDTVEYSDYNSTIATIPYDNSTPTTSEGAEFFSIDYTPVSDDSTILVFAQVYLGNSESATAIAGMFVDNIPNAVVAGSGFLGQGNAQAVLVPLQYTYANTSTAQKSFKIRAGSDTGTTYVNGSAGGGVFGGVCNSFIKVIEITN